MTKTGQEAYTPPAPFRAEIIDWQVLIIAGGHSAKEASHAHLEGREYTIQDGDIPNFRVHV